MLNVSLDELGCGADLYLDDVASRTLLVLLDSSVIAPAEILGMTDAQRLGLVALRDQLLHQVADELGYDINDIDQMTSLYKSVKHSLAEGVNV